MKILLVNKDRNSNHKQNNYFHKMLICKDHKNKIFKILLKEAKDHNNNYNNKRIKGVSHSLQI